MRVDLRVKYDVETRSHAAELFDSGVGCWGASRALSVPKCLAAGEMALASVCRKLHAEGNACKGASRLLWREYGSGSRSSI